VTERPGRAGDRTAALAAWMTVLLVSASILAAAAVLKSIHP